MVHMTVKDQLRLRIITINMPDYIIDGIYGNLIKTDLFHLFCHQVCRIFFLHAQARRLNQVLGEADETLPVDFNGALVHKFISGARDSTVFRSFCSDFFMFLSQY